MTRIPLFLILIFFNGFSYAQQSFIGLNQLFTGIYQPSFSAGDNSASMSVVNRRTYITSGVSYQHNIFATEFPLIMKSSGKRFGGFGLHVSNKDAGNTDILRTFQAAASIAYNVTITHDQFINFGIQSIYNNKKTSLQSVTTGSQWLAEEFRFDPTADIGEHFVQNSIHYLAVHAGIGWHWEDRRTRRAKVKASFSAYNLNKPNDSFLVDRNRLLPSYLFNAGLLLYDSKTVEVWPQLFYAHSAVGSTSNIQVSTKFKFVNENPYDIIHSGAIELLGASDFNNSLSAGMILHQPSLSIGFSYNFNVGNSVTKNGFRNETEVCIRFMKSLWKPKTSTVVIQNTSINTKRKFDFNNSKPSQQPVVDNQLSDADVIQESIGNLAKVNSVRFELDKDFKFSFGRADLSAEAKLYLDELIVLLQKNAEYNLEVVGHTDNVGKPIVNYQLSSARAKAVAQYLIGNGISPDRVKYAGHGDTEPLAPNDTEDNRSKNRRVHFVIYVNR
jgi:type IX secretion system PorP/SprF family membrane protein